jgi:hypothetical protein
MEIRHPRTEFKPQQIPTSNIHNLWFPWSKYMKFLIFYNEETFQISIQRRSWASSVKLIQKWEKDSSTYHHNRSRKSWILYLYSFIEKASWSSGKIRNLTTLTWFCMVTWTFTTTDSTKLIKLSRLTQ